MGTERIVELYRYFCSSSGVCTDSRAITPNCIFIALHGQNFDGNAFAQQAIQQGAMLAVVDNPNVATHGCFVVDDTLLTLQQLATYHREQLKTKIIAITGTNGKTTTKELLAAVLARKYNVLATKGNLNNHIGVPLTLLELTRDVEIAIVEMGANHPGDIDELVRIAKPDCGLITNVGRAHLAGFGSFEGVVNTKTEMYRYLVDNGGTIIYNDGNEILAEQVRKLLPKGAVAYSDVVSEADVVGGGSPYLTVRVRVEGCNPLYEIKSNMVGSYNVENIVAAIAAGRYFGVEMDRIREALEGYFPQNNRSQYIETGKNTVIMDAYNANPSSMELAIRNFATISGASKLVILGQMLELGAYAGEEHRKVVKLLQQSELQNVFLVGKEFYGLQDNFMYFEAVEECIGFISKNTLRGYTVLLKGSRGVKLEKLLEFL